MLERPKLFMGPDSLTELPEENEKSVYDPRNGICTAIYGCQRCVKPARHKGAHEYVPVLRRD